MITIDQFSFSGLRALVRVDFNVPLNKAFEITDDTRMRAALPTIKKILADGGMPIVMSHLGRPKNGPEDKFSTGHLRAHLAELLGSDVISATDTIGSDAQRKVAALLPGQVLLLENTRFHAEETKGDRAFSESLAQLGDVYVNDAFGTAHRAHASTTVVADFFDANRKLFGYLMQAEIANADKVLKEAKAPVTAILGGAKVSDKIQIIKNLLDIADNIIIGGAMAYTFKKALGGETGKSLVETEHLDTARNLLNEAKSRGVKFHLPADSIIADDFAEGASIRQAASEAIPENWLGLDIGGTAIEEYSKVIAESNTILWNGPMGVFEWFNFQNGTRMIAEAIAKRTAEGAFSLIGGGDSVAAINKYKLADQVSYVSTGGGAMLEYFEGKVLPGIAAIRGEA